MSEKKDPYLSVREKVAIWLILWGIEILSPWKFSHQQTEYREELRALLKGKP